MMILRSFFILLMLCAAPSTWAAIYTYIDANGERVFTDQPPRQQHFETIQAAPPNRLPSPPVIQPPPAYQDSAEPLAPQYQVLRILTPEPDATLRANDRQLIVTISSEPSLLEGHRYRLILDGEPALDPSRSPVFRLQDIDRGTHWLAVEIINEQGFVLERTPAQPFHLRQITLSDKRRVRPCAQDEYGIRPECPLKDKPKDKPATLPFFKS